MWTVTKDKKGILACLAVSIFLSFLSTFSDWVIWLNMIFLELFVSWRLVNSGSNKSTKPFKKFKRTYYYVLCRLLGWLKKGVTPRDVVFALFVNVFPKVLRITFNEWLSIVDIHFVGNIYFIFISILLICLTLEKDW